MGAGSPVLWLNGKLCRVGRKGAIKRKRDWCEDGVPGGVSEKRRISARGRTGVQPELVVLAAGAVVSSRGGPFLTRGQRGRPPVRRCAAEDRLSAERSVSYSQSPSVYCQVAQ